MRLIKTMHIAGLIFTMGLNYATFAEEAATAEEVMSKVHQAAMALKEKREKF